MAKIAIVTRTKNRSIFLERAIKTIMSQTAKDYVHVIVNDGGDANELEGLLKSLPDKQRKIIHNKQSVGLVKALNQGIRAVDSQYISILDDDDTWASDRLERTLSFLEENPECNALVVKMNTVIENIVDDKIVKLDEYLHPDSGDGEISLYKQCMRNYVSNGIVTYSRALYETLGGYREDLKTAEDWDFGIRLLLQENVEVLRTEHPLFFYHQRPNATGDLGNSVHAGVNEQERSINIIRNNYLREDLRKGKFGPGHIMNQAVFDTANVVRLESHINYATDKQSKVNEHNFNEIKHLVQESNVIYRINRKLGRFKDSKA